MRRAATRAAPAAERIRRGSLCLHRHHTRRAQGAREPNWSRKRSTLELSINSAQQGLLNPPRHQLHPLVPGARHPGLGRADFVAGPTMAVR